MTLNQDLQFANASSDVQRAFNETPEKVLIETSTLLCRFSGSGQLVDRDNRIPAWWLFVETTRLPGGQVVDGMNLHRERAARLGKSLEDYLRVRAALSAQFNNPMTHQLRVIVAQPVYGFVGLASGQPEFQFKRRETEQAFFIGGVMQVWVPNLTLQVRLLP